MAAPAPRDDSTKRLAVDASDAAASTRSQAAPSIQTSLDGSGSKPPATPFAPPRADDPPESFGRYRIERKLGQGAMGVVYLAEDTQLGRMVALKIPKASTLDSPEALERFYREARTAATLRHPNICQVYDVGQIDGTHYLTMEYVVGKTLGNYINKAKLPQSRQVALLIRKIAGALETAHQLGIVHRDLKPANIMLDTQGEPKVMDFGLARLLNTTENARLTQTGMILGTPAYMAPELVRASPEDVASRTDIYALGVVMYQFLTGDLPFTGPVLMVFAQILTEQPKRPSELNSDVDPTLEAICLKMIAKDPDQRFASMQDVAAALTEFLKTGAVAGLETESSEPEFAAEIVDDSDPDDLPPWPGTDSASRRRRRPPAAEEVKPSYLSARLPWLVALVSIAIAVVSLLFSLKIREIMSEAEETNDRFTTLEPPRRPTAQPLDSESPQTPVAVELPVVDYAAERALAQRLEQEDAITTIRIPVTETREYFDPQSRRPQLRPLMLAVGQYQSQPDYVPKLPILNFVVEQVDLSHRANSDRIMPVPVEVWELLEKSQCSALHLPPVPLGAEGVQRLSRLTRLKYLYAADTGLSSGDLRQLKSLTKLVGLDLSRCPVDCDALADLPGLLPVHLTLDSTPADDTTLGKLELSQLVYLSLNSTAVTDAALQRLRPRALQTLLLANTQVTDQTLDQIDYWKQPSWKLSQLDVRQTKVSAARARQFAYSHPRCKILFTDGKNEKASWDGREYPEASLPAGILNFKPLLVSPDAPAEAKIPRRGTDDASALSGSPRSDSTNGRLRVLYLYTDKQRAAESFGKLLDENGFAADRVRPTVDQNLDFAPYRLVLIANDPPRLSDSQVTDLDKSGKPVIGLGEGGYRFFGMLKLLIGSPNGMHGQNTSLAPRNPEKSPFWKSVGRTVRHGEPLVLYQPGQTEHVGIYRIKALENVNLIGSEPMRNSAHFPLIEQDSRFVLWGFSGSPDEMTPVGRDLFVATCRYTAALEQLEQLDEEPAELMGSRDVKAKPDSLSLDSDTDAHEEADTENLIPAGRLRLNLSLEDNREEDVAVEIHAESNNGGKTRDVETRKLRTPQTSDIDVSRYPPGNYIVHFSVPKHAGQWRRFKITDAGIEPPRLDVQLCRKRYVVMRYAFNSSGGRKLKGSGVKSGRVAVAHWSNVPSFHVDWQVWQQFGDGLSATGHRLDLQFHREGPGFGFSQAPEGSDYDELTEIPADATFRCTGFRAEPGLTLLYRTSDRTSNGRQDAGYGKLLIEDVTETPPKGVEIIDSRK